MLCWIKGPYAPFGVTELSLWLFLVLVVKLVEVLFAPWWLRFEDEILIWYSLLPGMLVRLTAIKDCEMSLLLVEICIWLVKAVAGCWTPLYPFVFLVIREDLVCDEGREAFDCSYWFTSEWLPLSLRAL
jgi:hypothetical protein